MSLPLMGICCRVPLLAKQAQQLSVFLDIPLRKTFPHSAESGQFLMVLSEYGLQLQETGKKAPGPVYVDFVRGANAHRRQYGGGKGQMIAKAIGLKGSYRPHVIDVTAGLGQDGFVLATLGCQVTLVERCLVVYALLRDGLDRAILSADVELQQIVSCIKLEQGDSLEYLSGLSEPADVIYLDPMFPDRKSKAEVNKNMKAFHRLVGSDNDAGELLVAALDKALYRVVVKRPRKAPALHLQYPELPLPAPSTIFEGKSTRYDVYPLKKMP
jgi:16S rRNA (guanine1516-N2)-methyltransferase